MKTHECVQGHVHKLRMHRDGSGLCVMSYDCFSNHMNATTSGLIRVLVTDSEDPSQLDLRACACSNYGRAVMVVIFKHFRWSDWS